MSRAQARLETPLLIQEGRRVSAWGGHLFIEASDRAHFLSNPPLTGLQSCKTGTFSSEIVHFQRTFCQRYTCFHIYSRVDLHF